MTATQTPRPQPKAHPIFPRIHYVVLNGIKMYCTQPNCDGTHHFFCSCRHEH